MGFQNRRILEALRGLCPPQAGPANCFDDCSRVRDALQRVGERYGRDGAGVHEKCFDEVCDRGGADEGPGGIVDQDKVGLEPGEGLETGQDGGLPRRPTRDWRPQLAGADGQALLINRHVVGMNDDLHIAHGIVAEKRREGAGQYRRAADRGVLLRHLAARARAASGGDDESGDLQGQNLHGVPACRKPPDHQRSLGQSVRLLATSGQLGKDVVCACE